MATYREPGVEITQVQETVTVNAGISDLKSGIVGPAYKVVDLTDFTYEWLSKTGVEKTLTLTSISGVEDGTVIDESSIIVEFVSRTNEIIPFYPAGSNGATLDVSSLPSIVFQKTGGADDIEDILPLLVSGTPEVLSAYRPKIAYRAQYVNKKVENTIATTEDLLNNTGKASSLNPLGFAANVMYQNSPNEFSVFAISGTEDINYNEARDFLDFSDTYAFAVLTQKKSEILNGYVNWVKDRSLPVNGYPSKLYMNTVTPWYKDASNSASVEQLEDITGIDPTNFLFSVDQIPSSGRGKTAEVTAAGNAQILSKRVSSLHPDMGWISEKRNVLQTNPAYVLATSEVAGGKCVLDESIKLLDGTLYSKGTIINTTVYNNLVDTTKFNKSEVIVLVPVAGYILAVQRAALTSALNPSTPKTGYPVSGINKLSYTENFFGKTNTNVIAGGGTEVMIQPTIGVLPTSRHHLTTDITSTQTKEDNVVHQVDVVTINYKQALRKLAGKYKQDAKYYKLLRATLTAYAESFVLKGYCKKLEVLEVIQDATEPDKVKVTLRITPFYAANYIDVTIFYH